MHKKFYASGFLYCSSTQQILLQQHSLTPSQWSLFGQESGDTVLFQEVFQQAIKNILKVKIPLSNIEPVYDYFDNHLRKQHYIVYAHIEKLEEIKIGKKKPISWFTFKQISKLPFAPQTKQDVMIGQRVLAAFARKSQGIEGSNLVNQG